jgi:hypothetical protein
LYQNLESQEEWQAPSQVLKLKRSLIPPFVTTDFFLKNMVSRHILAAQKGPRIRLRAPKRWIPAEANGTHLLGLRTKAQERRLNKAGWIKQFKTYRVNLEATLSQLRLPGIARGNAVQLK